MLEVSLGGLLWVLLKQIGVEIQEAKPRNRWQVNIILVDIPTSGAPVC